MSTPDNTTHRDDQPDTGKTAAERLGGPSETGTGTSPSRPSRPSSGTGATGDQGAATLIAPDRAQSYRGRWNELKGEFVDEPRRAVRGANELVGEVLDELEGLFKRQREELERGLDSDQTSTEDLRQALSRYGSFFDRLLSL